MSIHERVYDAVNMMRLLADHGMESLQVYGDLKDSLQEDAVIMSKAIAKARRAEVESVRRARAAERAGNPAVSTGVANV